jgi:UDP-glucose 4-epimerase
MARLLTRAGHAVTVLDSLLSGHADAVAPPAALVRGDVRDRKLLAELFRARPVDAIFHFASRIQVGESVISPRLYWRDNLGAALELCESALDAGVLRFVLSSTAAVYGNPIRIPIDEEHPTQPVNAYGETKLAMERMLASYARAYGMRYAALRYFNAAGADVEAGLRERHDPETHLIPLVLDAAAGTRGALTIYGDDYDTPDGTCVRDYIHVVDLAEAHLAALAYLDAGGESGAFNLGTGRGHSVREVVACVERLTGRPVPFVIGARRAGDPPFLVASADRAKERLGWAAKRSTLEEIVSDAWRVRGG